MNLSVFHSGIRELRIAFSGFLPKNEQIEFWWECLRGMTDYVFTHAIEQIIQNETTRLGSNLVAIVTKYARDTHKPNEFKMEPHELRQREWMLNELAAGRGYGDPTLAERMKKGRKDFSWRDV